MALSPESLEAELDSLKVRVSGLEARVRTTEKAVETLWTPHWKRLWFWLDGWPLYRVVQPSEKRWRPWDRWRR